MPGARSLQSLSERGGALPTRQRSIAVDELTDLPNHVKIQARRAALLASPRPRRTRHDPPLAGETVALG